MHVNSLNIWGVPLRTSGILFWLIWQNLFKHLVLMDEAICMNPLSKCLNLYPAPPTFLLFKVGQGARFAVVHFLFGYHGLLFARFLL